MAKLNEKTAALALYMSASTPEDYTAAAHALAAVLDAQARPKPVTGPDLAAKLPALTKRATLAGAVCEWSDGSSTYQRVGYMKPADRFAAAFQACDRLRRLRARHQWRASLRADVVTMFGDDVSPSLAGHMAQTLCGDTATIMGIWRDTPDWMAYVAAHPMPHLVGVLFEETGEAFAPPAGTTYGAGDALAAAEALERMTPQSATVMQAVAPYAVFAEAA